MRLINKLLVATTLTVSLAASNASAELILGAKAGIGDIDVPNSDATLNGSLQVGYEIWDIIAADIALEAEISTSLSDGEIANQDTTVDTKGLYLSARTAGPIYGIGRVGYVNTEINIEGVATDDDTDLSYGVGIGFSTVGLRWELEYTVYNMDTSVFPETEIKYISLGVSF